ncbi:hypothetical protein [Streptomyces sp. Isolate_219]|uniref:hypothetical protein n=1 Tax=Streptomyces sp. Isolate_219 TaxID=2950110 RepID=UPI0021C85D7F|nr:hypothetical protein [Streptomyces sp. Isolate_219]MCR8573048.1 hypothetical protein [Streptomyces sp. Isolate_219]
MVSQVYAEEMLPFDREATPEEAAEFKKRTAELRAVKQWHWNGNVESPVQCVELANQYPPCGPGEVMFTFDSRTGLFPLWLYY